jgi:hypothetical protein
MTPEQLHQQQESYVRQYVDGLFAGRVGHGQRLGVVYRVLRPKALEKIVRDAYQRGVAHALARKDKRR